jgi:hypothetical protein
VSKPTQSSCFNIIYYNVFITDLMHKLLVYLHIIR